MDCNRGPRGWLLLSVILAGLAAPLHGGDDPKDCLRRLDAMSGSEKQELERKARRFEQLSEDEKDELRQMHAELTAAPDAARLQEVMVRYHNWLKTLHPGQRAELLNLPPSDRIARIRSIMDEQSVQRISRFAASQLDREDVDAIRDWLNRYVDTHEAQILARLPEDSRALIRDATDDNHRRIRIVWSMVRAGLRENLDVSPQEIEQLVSSLSRDARSVLEQESDPDRRARIIRSWVTATVYAAFRKPVSSEELTRFVAEEANERDRAFLDSLPTERYRREAEKLYHFYQYRRMREKMGDNDGQPIFRPPFLRGPR
jgi:Mg/Co/Ni transporter MgtE